MTSEAQLSTAGVEIRETDLFEVWCHAMESGEWTQVAGKLAGAGNERCVLGVGVAMLRRAGLVIDGDIPDWRLMHPRVGEITLRAAQLLGEEFLAAANDGGHTFTVMAAALRRARLDVEASPIAFGHERYAPLATSPTYQAIIASLLVGASWAVKAS